MTEVENNINLMAQVSETNEFNQILIDLSQSINEYKNRDKIMENLNKMPLFKCLEVKKVATRKAILYPERSNLLEHGWMKRKPKPTIATLTEENRKLSAQKEEAETALIILLKKHRRHIVNFSQGDDKLESLIQKTNNEEVKQQLVDYLQLVQKSFLEIESKFYENEETIDRLRAENLMLREKLQMLRNNGDLQDAMPLTPVQESSDEQQPDDEGISVTPAESASTEDEPGLDDSFVELFDDLDLDGDLEENKGEDFEYESTAAKGEDFEYESNNNVSLEEKKNSVIY